MSMPGGRVTRRGPVRKPAGGNAGAAGGGNTGAAGGGGAGAAGGNQRPNPLPVPQGNNTPDPDGFLQLKIDKDSATDQREYEQHRLPNGLRIVLARTTLTNDEEVVRGHRVSTHRRIVVGLAVKAGLNDDPPEHPGLAHLLEHLSSSFHNPADVFANQAVMGEMPDRINFTTEDHTMYRFSLRNPSPNMRDGLKTVLGQFNYDINNTNAVSDMALRLEAEMIGQEAELHTGNGYFRFQEFTRLLCPEGGTRRFGRGNAASLLKSDADLPKLRTALANFIQQHYTFDNAVLVLMGVDTSAFSMQDLREHANDIWQKLTMFQGAAPSGTTPRTSSSALGPSVPKRTCPYGPGGKPQSRSANDVFNQIYYLQPPMDEDKIYMIWHVNYWGQEEKYTKVQPLLYIAALITSCHEGGLIAHLRNSGLILGLGVGISRRSTDNIDTNIEDIVTAWPRRNGSQLFTISLHLTRKGTKSPNEVISAVMCYIHKLEANEKKYGLIQNLRKSHTEVFGAYRIPEETVLKIACSALYPEKYNENILTDDILLHGYDQDVIDGVLKILKSTDELNVAIMAHLGQDQLSLFQNLREYESADGQMMGFKIANRDFSDAEKTAWSSATACNGIGATFRMPSEDEIGALIGNKDWEAARAQISAGLGQLGRSNPGKSSGGYYMPPERGQRDGGREFHIRDAVFHTPQPYSSIKVQIWQPDYNIHPASITRAAGSTPPSVPGKQRALWILLATMLKMRAKLVAPTLSHQELAVFDAYNDDSTKSGLWIKIDGLHHLVTSWLLSVLHWLSAPADGFGDMKDAIFESARKQLLFEIYSPPTFAKDVSLRGLMTGHEPSIECHNYLIELANAGDVYSRITNFLQENRIVIFARTNLGGGQAFEQQGAQGAELRPAFKTALQNLPPYIPDIPSGTHNTHLGTFYRWLHLKPRHPYEIGFVSPNKQSRLTVVRHTYQMTWFIQKQLSMTYTNDARPEMNDKGLPTLYVQVACDARLYTDVQISTAIEKAIEKAYATGMEPFLFPKLLSSDPDYRRYVVKIIGNKNPNTADQCNEPRHILYESFLNSTKLCDYSNAKTQERLIVQGPHGKEMKIGADLRDSISGYRNPYQTTP